MALYEIIPIVAKGGIVVLDGFVILLVFLHGKECLTKKILADDYLVFRTEERRLAEMEKDREIWRAQGRALYAWLPWIILFSLLLVVVAAIGSASAGPAR